MGEAADMILDGTLCSDCGAVFDDHDSPGHPRSCCDEDRKREKQQRRERAASDFRVARDLAIEHGMRLIGHSDTHYKLRHPDWTLEVYPGNQRLYQADRRGKAPYLKRDLPVDWTLTDVVKAAGAACRAASG